MENVGSRRLAWYGGGASAELFISALTVGEIRLGIERLRRRDTAQADLLEQWLRGLQVIYADHIVDVDAGVAEQWGRLNVPDPLRVIDGLLAASAITHGWTLVTRNVADIASLSVEPSSTATFPARQPANSAALPRSVPAS